MMTNNILSIKELSVESSEKDGLEILRKLNFSISKRESVGIIGETGSGKTMTARTIMGLLPRGFIRTSGQIQFDDVDLHLLTLQEMRTILGKDIAYIPQNPATALNPMYTIGAQFKFVLKRRLEIRNSKIEKISKEWLDNVMLPDLDRIYESYPCQLSGGQNQRVLIALALAVNPKLLIADEPTTALDSITRTEIIELLAKLQSELNLTLLLITHDVSIVRKLCDRVAVMYAGEIVENGLTGELFQNPQHPYLRGLLNALPSGNKKQLKPLSGEIPSFHNLPEGCIFHPRCPEIMDKCRKDLPLTYTIERDHFVRCFLMEKN